MTAVRLENLTKRFLTTAAVDSVDLSIDSGEFVVLVGPSGSGKTTCLRMIAGLETVTSGSIFIGDHDVANIHAKDRDVAMVFQNYALYPHLNVADNIAFGLRIRKESKDHGKGRMVEGPVEPGQHVVIVEDVVTTGGSSLRAIEQVEAFGLHVDGVIAIIDRLEGGAEAFARGTQ